ncbi:hypothetical protein CDD83_2971 [Cordyceps sp. RAO-2017]|nr:hypothetical protein CDD83_2971 [Cordyceps sp. RAO-2017]
MKYRGPREAMRREQECHATDRTTGPPKLHVSSGESSDEEPAPKKAKLDGAGLGDATQQARLEVDVRNILIPSDAQQRLEEGTFGEADCSLVLAQIALLYPMLLHHDSPRKRSEPSGSCNRLDAIIPQREGRYPKLGVPGGTRSECAPCSNIDRLEIGLRLSSDATSGTYDTILAVLAGRKPHTLLAEGPKAGFSQWKEVKLKEVFGSKKVAVRAVNRVGLIDLAYGGYFERDEWKVEGKASSPPR